jgi:putative ABC transport system permease protein
MNLATNGVVAPPQRVAFYCDVLERVGGLAGVESAGLIGDLFISSDAEPVVTFDGQDGITSMRIRLRVDEVSERLFTTVHTPLLGGRFFSREDGPDAPPVVIVNETLARRLWPGGNVVGRRFKFGPAESARVWMTIVGVVADMRRQGLEIGAVPQVFVPLAQQPSGNANLLVRASAEDPMTLAGAVRSAVGNVEARVPLYAVTTLEERLGRDLAQRRFQTSLVTAFSIAALLIAAAGIYGLVHYSVALRTKEIAVRMALGAARGGIFRLILGEGLQLTSMGLVLGLVAAWVVGQAVSSLLFGVGATDPLTFAIVSVVLLAAVAAACYFPARRATRIDPVSALQHV